jgi:hypothetical protein
MSPEDLMNCLDFIVNESATDFEMHEVGVDYRLYGVDHHRQITNERDENRFLLRLDVDGRPLLDIARGLRNDGDVLNRLHALQSIYLKTLNRAGPSANRLSHDPVNRRWRLYQQDRPYDIEKEDIEVKERQ